MNNITKGILVKYIGETNDWTFKNDLSKNSIGVVKNIYQNIEVLSYEVEFNNGIIALIDSNYIIELA